MDIMSYLKFGLCNKYFFNMSLNCDNDSFMLIFETIVFHILAL